MSEKKLTNTILLVFIGIASFISMVMSFVNNSAKTSETDTVMKSNYAIVEFDSNGGSDVKNQSLVVGQKVSRPADPTKAGYSFAGWYAGDEKWVFSGYSVSENIKLTAKWDLVEYNISYDLSEEEGFTAFNDSSNPTTYTVEDEITLAPPSMGDYSFVKWNMPVIAKGTTGDLTIKASWNIDFDVKFDSNGGTDIPSIVADKGQIITLPEVARGSSEFLGWFDGEKYVDETCAINRDTTFIAVWKDDFTYTINPDSSLMITGYNGVSSTVVLPPNATSIESSAFKNQIRITNVYLTDNITSIGSFAFDGCNSLTYNEYDGGLYLGNLENEYMWYIKTSNTNITEARLPSTTKYIYENAFRNCTALETVELSNELISIGQYAFTDCGSLKAITIPDKVRNIGLHAFLGCSSITRVKMNDLSNWCTISFENETANPMYYSKNLYYKNEIVTRLTLPSDIESISSYAFYDCSTISIVTIPANIKRIGSSAFYDCKTLSSVKISSLEHWCSILFSDQYSNPLRYANDLYVNDNNIKLLVIPSTVTSIGNYAFLGSSNITAVSIPEGVESIGIGAFMDCSALLNISLPNSLESLGENAFFNCPLLNYFEYENGCYLGNSGNHYQWLVKAKNTSIVECKIHTNTKHISNKAFDNCLVIETIYYDGTTEAFEQIDTTITEDYDVVCSNGTVPKQE